MNSPNLLSKYIIYSTSPDIWAGGCRTGGGGGAGRAVAGPGTLAPLSSGWLSAGPPVSGATCPRTAARTWDSEHRGDRDGTLIT